MMPGLDPKKMQAMMKQMGIAQEEINAKRVVIEKEGENIIIENPNVVKIKMQGNESFQITGDVSSEEEGISMDDVKLVMEKTGKSEDEVISALEKNPDIAEAIIELS
jgi:nascent polypeptide-associated complex subunit alpha